ncbi:MAG: hypothetical protein ATN35_01655 [Epulopiscium sp. Nele67-Bin004]|nr:MAG: hypothetical protein ATN35_01655 [Epulopiscium sp. Nele67-Bin004]
MKDVLKDLLSEDLVFINADFSDKKDFVEKAAEALAKKKLCTDKDAFVKDVFAREEQGDTDLPEEGVAIPHAKSSAIKKPKIVAATLSKPWAHPDSDNGISMVFLLAMPKNAADDHISVLSSLSTLLLDENEVKALRAAKSPKEFIKLMHVKKDNKEQTPNGAYDVVAVTACPTGVAHTYIAAQKLVSEAESMGLKLKVETQGSIGVENALTSEDIKNAKAVILACDKSVEKSRFNGKHLTETGVSEAIKNPHALIRKALANTKVFTSESTQSDDQPRTPLYRYLMGGVSAIIPVVVVGGVYIALAIALSGVEAGSGINITNPILKHIEYVGGLAFGLMIPVMAGFIAVSIADRPGFVPGAVGGALAANLGTGFLGGILAGFLGGFFAARLAKIKLPQSVSAMLPIFIIPLVGTGLTVACISLVGEPIKSLIDGLTEFLKSMQSGSAVVLGAIIGAMIAFDMGGPVNKVAFLFGVTMIQEGIPEVMGMVAVAVCTPPLGIWLATRLRPSIFDTQEREAGLAALFMGLIGITEGAIPFAVANPLKVIPALISGSMVGGILAALWKVGDNAPHGGPIVLPVVNNPIGFIIAIIAGTVTTALVLIALLHKNKK